MKAGCCVPREALSDRELVSLVQTGDLSAFTILSDRYLPVLRKRAGRYAGIAGVDLEDFVQEGMFALFRAVKGFDPKAGAGFGTYAAACINHSMSDAIKAFMRNARRHSHLCLDDLDEHKLSGNQPAFSRENPVEDTYIDREASHLRAWQIENLLSDYEQHVLKLYLRGHTYRQISLILSTSVKAVDNALQRVRKKLRPEL